MCSTRAWPPGVPPLTPGDRAADGGEAAAAAARCAAGPTPGCCRHLLPGNRSAGAMDRGLRGAPAACTILILWIGLQLHRGMTEVVHFGPLILQLSENSTITKNASVPDKTFEVVFPVTVSSEDPAPTETVTLHFPDYVATVGPTQPLSSEAHLLDNVFSTQSPWSETWAETSSSLSVTILQYSTTAQLPETYSVRSEVVESSPYVTASLKVSSSIMEESLAVPPPETFSSVNRNSWTTEMFPLTSDYGEDIVTSKFSLQSTESEQLSTDFSFSIEDTMVASTTLEASPSPWPVTPIESTYMPSMTITSTTTKPPLYSIYSYLGFVSAQDSTISLTEPLPFTSSPNVLGGVESPVMPTPESTFHLLPSSVPAAVPETSYMVTSDIMYTQWWSEDYMETITIKTSGFPGNIPSTRVVTDQEASTVEVVDSVSSSLPIPIVSSHYPASSVDFTDVIDSTEVQVTSASSQSSDMESHWVSSVELTLMPSMPVSSVPSVDLETTFSTTATSTPFLLETSIYEPEITAEAPAFVPAESGMYFSPTLSPPVESTVMSVLDSSDFLFISTPEPSGLFSSSVEVVFPSPSLASSHVSAFEPQDSSTLLAISESMFSSSMTEIYSSSILETIGMEVLPWDTVYSTARSSFAPPSSVDWTESGSYMSSELSEMWEVKSTIMPLSILYTSSTFTGATDLLPLLSSSALNSTTFALPTSSFGLDHASSALVEEVLPTSLPTLVPMMTLPPESLSTSDASGVYTSLFSVSTFISAGFTSAPIMPTIPSISLESTINVAATLGQSSMNPTSTVSELLSSSSQPTMTLVFPPTTPHTPDVRPSPSPTSPVNAIGTTSIPTSTPNSMPSSTPSSTPGSTPSSRPSSTPSSRPSSTPGSTPSSRPSSTPGSTPSSRPSSTQSSSTPAAVTHNTLDTTTPQVATTIVLTPGATTATSTLSGMVTPPSGLTAATTVTTTRPSFVCDVSNPEPYLVTIVLSRGSNMENITEIIRETLNTNFSRSVELEVYSMYDGFSFMVTSGPFVYTAIAVGHVLSRSALVVGRFPPILSLQTAFIGLDLRFHVQTVLQFVPQSVDIRLCTFSEQIQKGLTMALYEVRRLRQESENFTVQIVNISSSAPRVGYWKVPVTIAYVVRERHGFLNGSDVSDQLRNLSLVEFSFFLGFPVKQIAEPSTYPQLNISPLLKDSWLRTILLGVQEQHLRDEAFQTEMERKLALLISEATLQKRRWRRASYAGSNAVQVVNASRLDGQDDPVQLVYFVEDQYGERLAADKASSLMNDVDIQRAAIILGYRLQGVVAQPLNQPSESDRQAQNLWIIVGVAVPVLVVTVIIIILYWKLCRTDKLDFQPDTISNLQQRQKLQAPNVKGFDFAKQHLGQHNKDEVLVVHEPPPPVLHGPLKDSTPSENGDIPTPRSKSSSKPNKIGRHRSSRVTPSDVGSTGSDPSSGKESAEEGSPTRPSAPPQETRLRPTGRGGEIPMLNSGAEQHSSASIFEHVDRMSRSSEASRRLPSKIQLIAMQPMAAPPSHGLSTAAAEREVEANKIQTTLRHKSEIEHHRNKIRLRAKRKGHYEFPLVDVVGMTDTKERQRMYRRAQMQFDKILDPVLGVPSVFIEPRRSSRSRRSPKQRRRQQGSSSPPDADRDRLITTDSDGTYKRPPGVSNSAYVSDPDLPSDNPVSDLGKYSASPPRIPTQYVAPQPTIEEVRQTMQSLLDDAFALVAPSSQGPGALQSGNTSGPQAGNGSSARTGQGSAPWRGQYPSHQSPHYSRFVDFGGPQGSGPSLMTRSPGFGSGFLPPTETAPTESQQAEGQYPGRMYPEDIPSVARPRPLGSNSGSAQIHQLTQVGIASRMGAQSSELAPSRSVQPSSGPGWPSYYGHEDETPRNAAHRDTGHTHGAHDYSGPQMFSVNRGPNRQPSSHLPPSICYPSSSAEDIHPGHSSASLIKAIREELLRLSQKQAVVPTYHS
ncbi:UPF0606 protein KIAA1549 homolog isoform X2 [Hyla sarda]|uniref:UPF0606 protein KIAA1549 homolog isoform X2 n=1 Tax=Hyla sarda TaxID=327740 RepID=UPI0024C26212|nr:UPF0606 protein KIAA1549 homolog isoform X2 [Hyla sarda]